MPIWEEQQKQKTVKGIVLFPKTEAGIKKRKKRPAKQICKAFIKRRKILCIKVKSIKLYRWGGVEQRCVFAH